MRIHERTLTSFVHQNQVFAIIWLHWD